MGPFHGVASYVCAINCGAKLKLFNLTTKFFSSSVAFFFFIFLFFSLILLEINPYFYFNCSFVSLSTSLKDEKVLFIYSED